MYSTSVGLRGITPNPTYEEVCSGLTGHTEVVQVVFDPAVVSLERLLQLFWESHDPTQGMRQGNDTGTQYRSAIHATDEAQYAAALASREAYQAQLDAAGYGRSPPRSCTRHGGYYAEDYHQQYLAKNPNGYCGIGGTGVSCPIGLDVERRADARWSCGGQRQRLKAKAKSQSQSGSGLLLVGWGGVGWQDTP